MLRPLTERASTAQVQASKAASSREKPVMPESAMAYFLFAVGAGPPGWAVQAGLVFSTLRHLATLAACCSAVAAKTCPPEPSATKNRSPESAGSSAAARAARPGLQIGPAGRPSLA